MPDLLFEIGCEELPPGDVASGERQLEAVVRRSCEEARLRLEGLEVFATPRRLAALVRGLAPEQEPTAEERRGPPVEKAIADDGSFTKAAEGFARANDVAPEDLVRVETPQGEYLFARTEHPGEPAAEILPALLAGVVDDLRFPRTMRWDASGVRFPRPIRWLLALLDDTVLPVRVGALVAGRETRGHRVFHPQVLEITEASAYEARLREAGVLAGRGERREAVREAAEAAAAEAGGRPILHPEVLDQVTDLVERPAALTGRFADDYLELPREVLVTVMEAHQRYFGIEDPEGALLGAFVCVSNADPANAETIVAGNERVLRARLEDARFFFAEDLEKTLSARMEDLGELVLHARLGTMLDKVRRVAAFVERTAPALGLSPEEATSARRAAELCKADLLTHLVYEFPELQGVMGREYAKRDPALREELGERLEAVSEAVREHYLPRFAEDDLPSSASGVALALADRLDTLVGYLGIGLEPSGSEDPFALRRQATAFAQISLVHGVGVPLAEAVRDLHAAYGDGGVELDPVEACIERVVGLVRARAVALLEREGVPRAFVDAALGAGPEDVAELGSRARALGSMHRQGRLHSLAVAHERAFNLSRDASPEAVDEGALEHPSERDLYAALDEAERAVDDRLVSGDHAGALDVLGPLVEVIEVFFDKDRGVLVMDPEERLRRNRLALLARTAQLFGRIADLSVIPPKELEGNGADGATQASTQEA